MDELVKVWVLLVSGLFLWLIPPAFKLGKLPAVVCFNGAIACLTVANFTSKRLIKVESLITRQTLLEEDLINSELAWQADQQEEQLKQKYLLSHEVEPAAMEVDTREQLQRNLEATDRLVNELLDRQKKVDKPKPLLSKGGQKLLEYASKKDWLDLRTLAKNWGRNNEFNSKEVESFCQELVTAKLAEWSENKEWRVIRETS